MDKEWAEKWCDALESGNYKQGRHYLKMKDLDSGDYLYCCLGVLCEIAEIQQLKSKDCYPFVLKDGNIINVEISHFDCFSTSLPKSVMDKTKMMTPFGTIQEAVSVFNTNQEETTVNGYKSLTGANDNGVSFQEIAGWIRKNYELI